MEKIVEIYPSVEEVKQQIEYRKTFGWSADTTLTDRGVFEVTFTRETNARNQKLGTIENEFMECANAADYIERYNTVTVDKKKFKAFHPFILLVVIYIVFSMILQGVMLTAITTLLKTDPSFAEQLPITVGEEQVILDENWSMELNLEEMGIYELVNSFGVEEKILTVTTKMLLDFLFYVGVGSLAIGVIVLIWAIKKSLTAKTFYKAELEYVKNRKDLLNEKVDDLEDRMDDLIRQAKKA